MTVSPQPDTQMNEFFQQNPPEPTTPTAPNPEPQVAAEPQDQTPQTPDYWSEPVDDPRLPPSLKGRTRKEVWDTNLDAIAQAHRANQLKNQADTELQVERATRLALQRHLDALASNQPQQSAHQRIGIPDPMMAPPEQVIDATLGYVDRSQQATMQQIERTVINPMRQELLEVRGDRAQQRAMKVMKLDEASWEAARPATVGLMMLYNLNPADSSHWQWAAQSALDSAKRLVPHVQVTPTPTAPQTGNTPPGIQAAPTQPKRNSTGNKYLDKQLQEHLDIWNSSPGVKKMTLSEFSEMIAGDMASGFAGFTGGE